MNTIMAAVMKPIPVPTNSRSELCRRQEEYVLTWLQAYPNSVTRHIVRRDCLNIPGVSDEQAPNWLHNNPYKQASICSSILQRLERKGYIVSTLCGNCRYYSIPVKNGGAN